MSAPVLIYVTVHTEKNAELIANSLIKEKAAAAVQTTPINSTYWWQDEVVTRGEFILIIKTLKNHYGAVRDIISKRHTYDVPVMEMIEVSKVEPSHLQWLQDNLA